jgi:hypothetical protein
MLPCKTYCQFRSERTPSPRSEGKLRNQCPRIQIFPLTS